MSEKFEQTKYDSLFEELNKVVKRVEVSKSPGRKLTKNADKLLNYKISIVNAHNELVKYIASYYNKFNNDSKKIICEKIKANRTRIDNCFEILQLTFKWEENLVKQIEVDQITSLTTSDHSDQDSENLGVSDTEAGPSTDLHKTDSLEQQEVTEQDKTTNSITDFDQEEETGNLTINDTNTEVIIDDLNQVDIDEFSTPEQERTLNDFTMTQTKAEFLKTASSILNSKFSGDPLKLSSFLSEVELVCELAEAANKPLCLRFVLAKLDGKALECIPNNPQTIEEVVNALKAEIKPENSQIIEGKMAALRIEKGNFSKFSEQAEKLAEALRRTLIVEGIPKAKAQQLTVDRTIEMCRKMARSEIVKSVLSAKSFESPQDVIAKFVIENATVRKEVRDTNIKSKGPGQNNRGNKRFMRRGGYNGRSNYGNRNSGQGQNFVRNDRGFARGRGRGGGPQRGGRHEVPVRFVQGNELTLQAEQQE